MKRSLVITLVLILLLPLFSEAQRWKRYRRQLVIGAGVTNFLGDLGGGNAEGRNSIADLDLNATRPAILVGYRYQLNSFFFLRGNLTWGILRGDDKFTEDKFRKGRNLHFRSGFVEANFMGEFYLIQNARSNLYNLRGVRGRSGLGLDLYLFGGIGLMYFNPKAELNGEWIALQPLGTEGQGLPGMPDKYNRLTMTIPYGVGIGKTLDRYWSVNVELTMRHTFTDNIDDVNGEFFGREELRAAKLANGASPEEANQAATLSDRNIFHTTIADISRFEPGDQVEPGGQRGDDQDDFFMTGIITISRKIVRRRRSRPKF